MIHTAQLLKPLSRLEVQYIEKKYNENINLLREIISKDEIGISAKFYYFSMKKKWLMYINIDFIKLLGTSEITEDHYPVIEEKIVKFINYIFDCDKEFSLVRLDYRIDCQLDEVYRKELLKILRKTYRKRKFLKKNDKFDTTIYLTSKSLQCAIYDKEAERGAKRKKIEDFEKDILRFEVRLRNKHLLYMKSKNGVERTLKNYISNDLFKKYIINNLKEFIPPGDFVKISEADKRIKNSNLSEKDKKFLREFIIDISKSSLTSIKGKMVGKKPDEKLKYSNYKINKAIRLLTSLEINPILIPKNDRCSKIIKNPLKDLYL